MIESRQEIRRAVVLHVHPVDHLLVVPPLRVLHLAQIRIVAAKIYLRVVVPAIAEVQPVTSVRVVKSAIHEGFVQRHKNAINRVSVRASSNPIFQMM
jgi:energy-converting hydrogenase Eha subunit C